LIAKSTVRESRKLDNRETIGVKAKKAKKTTMYFWYNGSTSDQGGEKVGKTGVKAKGEKPGKAPYDRPETK